MNNLDKQYQDLLRDILENGVKKETRNGDTLSIFGRQIRHKMSDGFPLLTTKKMAWNAIVSELQWFLSGSTDIRYLWAKNCHIWDGDYKKSGRTDFQLGPIYGKQWKQWQGWLVKDGKAIGSLWYDQIARLITDLKTNPDSRRLMVSSWNVAELDKMVLPPCHYIFQCYSRLLSFEEKWELLESKYDDEAGYIGAMSENIKTEEELNKACIELGSPLRSLSLMWNQRSVDTFLGLPFNIASYGLLLTMLADEVNMMPDELIGSLGDVHLYSNHIDQAKIQLNRDPYSLPTISIQDGIHSNMPGDIKLIDYISHPAIKAPLSN